MDPSLKRKVKRLTWTGAWLSPIFPPPLLPLLFLLLLLELLLVLEAPAKLNKISKHMCCLPSNDAKKMFEIREWWKRMQKPPWQRRHKDDQSESNYGKMCKLTHLNVIVRLKLESKLLKFIKLYVVKKLRV